MNKLLLVVAAILSSCGESSQSKPDSIETIARYSCWSAIEGAAVNKSSVDFHSFASPPVVRKINDGRLEVFVKFSEKNVFGSKSTSIARCVLSGDGSLLIEMTTQDSA